MPLLRIGQTVTPAEAPEDNVPGGTPTNVRPMEVGHVLFMDVVGFSKLPMTQQANVQTELQRRVQETPEVQQARQEGKLIARFTGDGMALIFLRDLLSPVRCALQLQNTLKARDAEIRKTVGAPIILRMGIHSGPVLLVEDMNEQSDVAGEGIIVAQRVMDCGDAGHILLSDEIARKLLQIDPWPRYLKDFGVCRVKHGVTLHLYNLYGRFDGQYCGNPGMPGKVAADEAARAREMKRFRGTLFERNPAAVRWIKALCVLLVLGAGGYALWESNPAVRQFAVTTYGRLTHIAAPTAPKTVAKLNKTAKGKPVSARMMTTPREVPAPVVASNTVEAPRILVPDLLGKSVDEAADLVRPDGLHVKRSPKSGYNAQYPEGIIYQQSPASGSYLIAGKPIFVRVSKGDPPDPASVVEETSSDSDTSSDTTPDSTAPTAAAPAAPASK
jgi:class 3 adenylate cyclase